MGQQAMSGADVSELDGQAVMALLLGAVRAERFCDGALLGFFGGREHETLAVEVERD